MTAERLRWDGHGQFRSASEPGDVQIVDSWLVNDGQVRALARHAERFCSACADLLALPFARTSAFFDAAVARIPLRGQWFPRVELSVVEGSWHLQLWLRPAPPLGDSVRVWIAAGPDERKRPDIKGIDLDRLAGLRKSATSAGADEAVLLDADGRVLEGATTSILWWRGDTLCAPADSPELLGGVTRKVLVEAVAASGGRFRAERPLPQELDGLEVWAVNALHGIRPVTDWIGTTATAGGADRAAGWQSYLDWLATPIAAD